MASPTLSYVADDILADALLENSMVLAKRHPRKAKTEIQRFFTGHILLTGATGNLGKVVLAKLLRICPKIKSLYITIRVKDGMSTIDRKKKLLEESIFSAILQEQPELKEKVIPIASDLSEVNLALSDVNEKILKDKVSIIIHCAATVNDENLSTSTRTNVRGTLDLLNFAKECINMRAFTHVSPLFALPREPEICEKFYNLPTMANKLMDLKDTDFEAISALAAKVIEEYPNFHVFTKALTENVIQKLVEKYKEELPVCIVRLTRMCASYEEPVPGWIGTNYRLLTALESIVSEDVDDNQTVDIIPIDYAANLVLAATYDISIKTRNESSPYVPIHNLSNYGKNSVTCGQYKEKMIKYRRENPSKDSFRYSAGLKVTNILVYRYVDFLLNYIPTTLKDLYLGVTGQETKYLQMHNKPLKSADHMAFRTIPVRSLGTRRLWSKISQADKVLFPFNVEQIDWEQFMEIQCADVHKYTVEKDTSITSHWKQQFQRLRGIQLVIFTLWHVLVLYLLYKLLSIFVFMS